MNEPMSEVKNNLKAGVGEFCKRTWWSFLIGGIASIIFGILAFINPGIALLVLGIFFAASVLVDSLANIWGALQNRDRDGWWLLLLMGVIGAAAALYILLVPPLSMIAFIYVVSFIAFVLGATMLMLGWKIRAEIPNEWILYLSGVASIAFAIMILVNPGIGGLSVVYTIASWAIILGVLRTWFAFRIKNAGDRIATAN